VTGTAPVVSSGGATPAISMAAATTSVNGYLTSTDWTTFNNKGNGSVTSVAASVPAFLSVAGSPITSSGTLAITLSGTALPVLNGGTGVTTSTGTGNTVLSAAPTLSGDVNLSTGNLVIGTSGKGIDFSITSHPAGMTSELLADYEEGTWTPDIVNNGSTSTWATKTGYYTRVGNQVTMWFLCDSGNSGTAGTELRLSGFPYAYANTIANLQPGTILNIGGLSTFAALQMRSGTYARVVSAGNITIDTQLTYATGTLTFQV